MCNRFDQRGYLVRQLFGETKRQVFVIPGEVKTKTWRFAAGAAIRAQSLTYAHEWLDDYLERRRTRIGQGAVNGA